MFIVVSRHEDKGDILGVGKLPDVVMESDSVESRHKNVGDDQVNMFTFKSFPGLLPILRENYLVTVFPGEYPPSP